MKIKKRYDHKQFEIIDEKKQKSEWTEEKIREMQKPIWIRINKKEFDELTEDTYNNQNNNNFKFIINKETYDLKNAKIFSTKVTTDKNN